MNWPQSSYSQSNSSSTFNSSNQTGPGTPYTHQSLGGAGGYTGLQQQGYGTPGGSNSNIFSSGGYQSSSNVPSSLHQQTFSTSSPQHQQQQHQQAGGGAWQQQQQQQQGGMQGIGGYQSFGSGNQQQYGQSTGGFGNSMSQHAQQGQMMQNGSSYGGTTPYQQQFGTPGGNQYGSPQTGNSSMQAGNNAPSSGIGRYLPGYLTATSLSGSPRQSTSTVNHDGRLSPEQSHRDTGGSFGAGSSRLFASSTSSAGTAGRESPSRSPKQSLFSSSAYGSSRSLALTPATGSRPRRTSSNALVRSSHDDYMEEDAPPVDTLDDFDNDAGVPYVSSPPPHQPALTSTGNMSPSKRRDLILPNGSTSSSSAITQNGLASSSPSNMYKLIVFGFSPNLQSAVLKEFAAIAPLAYNSMQDPSPSSTANGPNWFTIAYDNDWAAMRALRKNGDIASDGAMIGVKLAEGSRAPEGSMLDLVPASSQQQQQQQSSNLPRSTTTSNLGTPATILPASQAFLSKPNNNGAAMKKSATMNKINDMGKIDASIFKQPDQNQQKQSGGVVGTLTNLIFGF